MVVVCTLRIGGDMNSFAKKFSVVHIAISILQVPLSFLYRFPLGAAQHQAGDVLVEQLILVRRASVLYVDVIGEALTGHKLPALCAINVTILRRSFKTAFAPAGRHSDR